MYVNGFDIVFSPHDFHANMIYVCCPCLTHKEMFHLLVLQSGVLIAAYKGPGPAVLAIIYIYENKHFKPRFIY